MVALRVMKMIALTVLLQLCMAQSQFSKLSSTLPHFNQTKFPVDFSSLFIAHTQYPTRGVIKVPQMDQAIGSFITCDVQQYQYLHTVNMTFNDAQHPSVVRWSTNQTHQHYETVWRYGYFITNNEYTSESDQRCIDTSIYIVNRPGLDLQRLRVDIEVRNVSKREKVSEEGHFEIIFESGPVTTEEEAHQLLLQQNRIVTPQVVELALCLLYLMSRKEV